MSRLTRERNVSRHARRDVDRNRSRRRAVVPLLETCEGRLLLTTFFVTNTAATGPGSLAQAVNDSNGDTTQANVIRFNISGQDKTITLNNALSTITQPVTIDGTTQSGYAGAPIVTLTGSTGATIGLNVSTSNVKIKGLALNGFSNTAIALGGAGGHTVTGCYIGTNTAGTGAGPANGTGIKITSPNNLIGGATAGSRNVISGSAISQYSTGISVSGATSTGNVIQGNYIGTDVTGTKAVGNYTGIQVQDVGVTIGGTSAAARNVISGNSAYGVVIASGNGSVIQGNYIGTDVSGTNAVPNNRTGLWVQLGTDVTVGGTAQGAGNVVSGNKEYGVYLGDSNNSVPAKSVTIQGNLIGTDQGGTRAVPNLGGLVILRGENILVGGIDSSARNVISGNSGAGIWNSSSGYSSATVFNTSFLGNFIGADIGGNPLGNGGAGITVAAPVGAGFAIGGSNPGEGNLIANNAGNGISADNSNFPIVGNQIINNDLNGVVVNGKQVSVQNNRISSNKGNAVVVGGTQVSVLNNVISENLGLGIKFNPTTAQPTPNKLLPAPYLTSVVDDAGGKKKLTGIVLPNQANIEGYRVQFFANPAYAADGTTGGSHFLGEVTVGTNAQSRAPFSFIYTPVSGLPVLSATVTDPSGNTSEFSVRPPAPVNYVPTSLTLDQNSSLTLSSDLGTNIIVTYANDAGTNQLKYTLSAAHGTLNLSRTTGLTGTGNGTGTLTYAGTLKDLNNALDGLVYTPSVGYNGNDQLTITSNNLAGPELGQDRTSTDSTVLMIQPLADTPNVTPATTSAETLTANGLVITPGSANPNAAYFKISAVANGSLFLADGVTPVASGSFITAAQGASGLRFMPASQFVGQGSFSVQSATAASDAGLVGTVGTGSITVNKLGSNTTLTASASTASVGQTVTFTANVSRPNSSGTVTFLEGSTVLGTKALSNGTAALDLTILPVGTHTILARYEGDGITQGSESAAITVSITAGVSSIVLAPPSSASVGFGDSVSFTATVTPTSATGTVSFLEGTTVVATRPLSNGSATFVTTTLAVGAHTLTARYDGDANTAQSTSGPQTVTVNAIATTTTLTVPSAPVSQGQAVTLTANVSPSSAAGSVEFLEGATVLATRPLSNGSAEYTVANLGVGVHTIIARYVGGGNHAGSTSAASTVTVNAPTATATQTSLTAQPATVALGQTVNFTATVSATSGGTLPTGSVVLLDGTITLDTQPLVNGSASFQVGTLAVGSHQITAQYVPSSSVAFNASASAVQTVTVSKSGSSTTLTASASTLNSGESVTFTAAVNPSSATGTVTFVEGATVLGSAPLVNGVASFTTSTLAVGSHTVTARYEGNSTYDASTSAAESVTVSQAPPTTIVTSLGLSASSASATLGQPLTFTATITPPAATGLVTFVEGATVLGSAPLVNGVASFTTATLPAGAHSIAARYAAGALYDGSDSAAVVVAVTTPTTPPSTAPSATTTILQVGQSPTPYGQATTFTALVTVPGSGVADGGQVRFVADTRLVGVAPVSNGAAVLRLNDLAAGSHVIQAYYEGTERFGSNVSTTATVVVVPSASRVTLAASPDSVLGGAATLVARVSPYLPAGGATPTASPTGTVQFFLGDLLLGNAAVGPDGVAILAANPPASPLLPTVRAVYTGDGNHFGATSPALNLPSTPPVVVDPIGPISTQTTLSASMPPRRSRGCYTVQVQAVVIGADGAPVSGGTVSFVPVFGRMVVANVVNGIAVATFRVGKPRAWSVQATFSGTPTHFGGISTKTHPVVVQPAPQTHTALPGRPGQRFRIIPRRR